LGAVNVDEQAQIQRPALSLEELIQPSTITALDRPFVSMAIIIAYDVAVCPLDRFTLGLRTPDTDSYEPDALTSESQ
jgi:hypothetical protein